MSRPVSSLLQPQPDLFVLYTSKQVNPQHISTDPTGAQLAMTIEGLAANRPNSPEDAPPAPWHLRGQAIAFFAGPFTLRLLVHYTGSPVGPYEEHALATLNLRGPHVFQMSVTSEASRRGGRKIWGFPKVIENLAWRQSGSRVVFERESEVFRVRASGPRFPLALPFWTAQRRGGQWVHVPGHIKGQAQIAWRGRQMALWLREFEMIIEAPYDAS